MKFTDQQMKAYVEYFTILARIQRRLDMEKRAEKERDDSTSTLKTETR